MEKWSPCSLGMPGMGNLNFRSNEMSGFYNIDFL